LLGPEGDLLAVVFIGYLVQPAIEVGGKAYAALLFRELGSDVDGPLDVEGAV
jgi:hypothetical protein